MKMAITWEILASIVLGELAGNQEMLGQRRPPSFSRPW